MKFTKMEGLGNDYIYLNCLDGMPEDVPELAMDKSRRHFSIGADGIICICSSEVADFRMAMFNADGSQGEMCGNGIRCVGKYLFDKGFTQKTELDIETLAGIRHLWLHLGDDGKVEEVTVHMGIPTVSPMLSLDVDGTEVKGIEVSVGNPHFIMLCDDVDNAPVEELGSQIEYHPHFPNRTNVEFIRLMAPRKIQMRVWERGSGETFACGTGACATFAAARSLGLCGDEAEIYLLGGVLKISVDKAGTGLLMRGGASIVCEGEWE